MVYKTSRLAISRIKKRNKNCMFKFTWGCCFVGSLSVGVAGQLTSRWLTLADTAVYISAPSLELNDNFETETSSSPVCPFGPTDAECYGERCQPARVCQSSVSFPQKVSNDRLNLLLQRWMRATCQSLTPLIGAHGNKVMSRLPYNIYIYIYYIQNDYFKTFK